MRLLPTGFAWTRSYQGPSFKLVSLPACALESWGTRPTWTRRSSTTPSSEPSKCGATSRRCRSPVSWTGRPTSWSTSAATVRDVEKCYLGGFLQLRRPSTAGGKRKGNRRHVCLCLIFNDVANRTRRRLPLRWQRWPPGSRLRSGARDRGRLPF